MAENQTQDNTEFQKGEFGEIAYAGLSDIKNDNIDNIRTGKLPAVDDLCLSLKEMGLMTPLVVKATYNDDGEVKHYDLVDGFRRFAAITKLNKDGYEGFDYEQIPVVLMDGGDEKFLLLSQATANLQREDTDPDDLATYVNRLVELGMSHGDVARKLGRRIEFVMNLIKYHQGADDELRQNVKEGRITVKAAVDMIDLPKDQQKIINDIARSEKNKQKAKDKTAKAAKTMKGEAVIEKPKQKDIQEKLDLVKGILSDKTLCKELDETQLLTLKAVATSLDWVCGQKNDVPVPKKVAKKWTESHQKEIESKKAQDEAKKLTERAEKAKKKAEEAAAKAKEIEEKAAAAAAAAAAA